MNEKPPQNRRENMMLSLSMNILLPVLFFKKGEAWLGVSPAMALVVALSFPVLYFVYDLATRRKVNAISILGFISILLTGGVGLLELPRTWFIIKEGTVPLIIGVVLLLSINTSKPLIRLFLFNEALFNVDLINNKLEQRNNRRSFNELMKTCSYLIAGSFLLSSIVQFVLASLIVTVEPKDNPSLFNEQVGDMTWISYFVIMVPSLAITGFALWKLVKGIEQLTDLSFEEMMHADVQKAAEKK